MASPSSRMRSPGNLWVDDVPCLSGARCSHLGAARQETELAIEATRRPLQAPFHPTAIRHTSGSNMDYDTTMGFPGEGPTRPKAHGALRQGERHLRDTRLEAAARHRRALGLTLLYTYLSEAGVTNVEAVRSAGRTSCSPKTWGNRCMPPLLLYACAPPRLRVGAGGNRWSS